MSDDRFDRDNVDQEPEPEHLITMLATVELRWVSGRWELTEPAHLQRAPGAEEIMCTHGMHLDSAVERARCDIQKERANGAPMPSRMAVRDAFDRALLAPALPVLGV